MDGLPAAPRWGAATLSDVMPSVLAALGAGGDNVLSLPETPRCVVALVDGLGLLDLQAHAAAAPYLSSLATTPLTAGFPSTTVASLVSLGTGLPPGQHGLTGYTSYVREVDEVVNWLAWRPVSASTDLRHDLVPEDAQPHPTVWERAQAAGIATTVVNKREFEDTGLTRAAFRGGRYDGASVAGDVVAVAAAAADRGFRSLVYCYASELDFAGHVRGPGTDAWVAQLAMVDRWVELLAARLPAGTTLLVTADHGMTLVPEGSKLDADAVPALRKGVTAIAGEPRARYVHARAGATADVLAAWQAEAGHLMHVLTVDEAIALGWWGPVVSDSARRRLGDVVAVAKEDGAVVQRRRESRLSSMPGAHGALTDRDLLVPLAVTSV